MIAIYLRVSTDMQDVGHQELAIHSWIKEQKYTDTQEIYTDDGISGKTTARPAYQKLITDIRAGLISKVIMFESSRASRDFMDYLMFRKMCADHGCSVEIPGKGALPFDSATDMFLAAVDGFTAQLEREKISERTKAGLRKARADGKVLGAPAGNKRRKGKYKHKDPALLEQILKLRQQAWTLAMISAKVGIPTTTIHRMIRRSG